MCLELGGKVVILDQDASLDVSRESAVREVRRTDEGTATVDDEQLRVKDGSGSALVGRPPPATRAGYCSKRFGVRTRVRSRAVLLGLEHDVDIAATTDSRLKVGCEPGERVRGEANEQDALGRVANELVEDRGREALLTGGARSRPDRSRPTRVCLAPRAEADPEGQRHAVAGQRRRRGPRCCERGDRSMCSGRCSSGHMTEGGLGPMSRVTSGGQCLDLCIAEPRKDVVDHALDGQVPAK